MVVSATVTNERFGAGKIIPEAAAQWYTVFSIVESDERTGRVKKRFATDGERHERGIKGAASFMTNDCYHA